MTKSNWPSKRGLRVSAQMTEKMTDRKALLRQYKETRRPAGIFVVRHRPTGRSFIGRSEDLPAILNRHRAQLKMGSHPVKALQEDWNADSEESFEFEALDTLSPPESDATWKPADDLRTLELLWFEKLNAEGVPLYTDRPKK